MERPRPVLRLGENDAAIEREGVELEREAGPAAVRSGGADPCPDGFLSVAALWP
jgi:hypothetical protein